MNGLLQKALSRENIMKIKDQELKRRERKKAKTVTVAYKDVRVVQCREKQKLWNLNKCGMSEMRLYGQAFFAWCLMSHLMRLLWLNQGRLCNVEMCRNL